MPKSSRLPILILLIALLLTSCLAAPVEAPTATAEIKDLTIAIEASGTIRAAQTAYLLWETSGEIAALHAVVGDRVTQDQLLAELRLESLPQGIILASANVHTAVQARDALETQYDATALAQAEIALTAAQQALADAEQLYQSTARVATDAEISNAQAKLTLAQKNLDDTVKSTSQLLRQLQDLVKNPFFDFRITAAQRAQFSLAELNAVQAFEAARDDYQELLAGPDPEDVAIAAANVQLAQAQLADAQLRVDLIQGGLPADERDAAEARILAAESIEAARQVTAPFAGTITHSDWLPGDRVNPGQVAFRLDDLSALFVDVFIAETDVNRVSLGQQVQVETESNPGVSYTGEIVSLAPVGQSQGGLITFKAEVRLLDPDDLLRPGMSADMRIVLETIQNALTAPSAAVRLLDDQRVVYIQGADGRPTPVVVELGRTVGGDVHITGGPLQPGDIILLEPPQ